jgi:hypothetical protein
VEGQRIALLNRAAVHAAAERARRAALEKQTTRMTAAELETARRQK